MLLISKGDSMNKKILGAALLGGCGMFACAAQADDLSCKMTFNLKGWSAIYKTYSGHGTVSCSDGSKLRVKLSSTGAGITAGKSSIDDGHGDFTGVRRIGDVVGDYAAGGAGAGAIKSAAGTVLTKGEVSLALGGTGRGWDLGVDIDKFTIEAEK
jgi:hypothetical protein